MVRLLIAVSFILVFSCFPEKTCALKVMTFNTYHSGVNVHEGTRKIADQIKYVNPDIVAFQESGEAQFYEKLIGHLGKEWSGVVHCRDKGIITRHTILEMFEVAQAGMNARIQLRNSGQEISIWSMHLEYRNYGPYVAERQDSTLEKILGAEGNGRIDDIVNLMKHPQFIQQIKNAENVPVIVAGDFNVPSHLDWTEATKSIHNNWVVEWPVTKLLSDVAGMTDSFREVHPDPLANPGLTWTVYKNDSGIVDVIKDRIDFIFYRGSLRAKSSDTFAGITPIVDDGTNAWRKNEWPSDHWAVVSEFENIPHKYEENSAFFMSPKYLSFFTNPQYRTFKMTNVTCPIKIIR